MFPLGVIIFSLFEVYNGRAFQLSSYSRVPISSRRPNSAFFATKKYAGGVAMEDVDAVVVGGGISGSTTAFYLQQKGINSVLTETKSELGGNVVSKKKNGFLWEEGPNSFQPNNHILRLARDLDMLPDLVLSNPNAPRYVYWDGKLHALPMSLGGLCETQLLSSNGIGSALLGAIGFISPKPSSEESVKDFFIRHLGDEIFQRVIDPFISGIYAGDPSKLSISAALPKIKSIEDGTFTGGILEGFLKKMFSKSVDSIDSDLDVTFANLPKVQSGSLGSFCNGLQSIPRRIKDYLGGGTVRLSHELIRLEREDLYWISTFKTPEGEKRFRSKTVLLTTPAFVTSHVLKGISDRINEASNSLDQIVYPPVASVTLAYPNDAFIQELDGFGHLIPRKMGVRTLGTIWSSSLFPGRVPDGYSMLLNYIGGAQDVHIKSLSREEIVQQVHSDLKQILLKRYAPDPIVLSARLWEKAIPQYDKGHLNLIKNVENALKTDAPGLFLGGSCKSGIAFGDCVKNGVDFADILGMYLMSL